MLRGFPALAAAATAPASDRLCVRAAEKKRVGLTSTAESLTETK